MNKQFLVSILIACYNGEKYIDRCLESCINQTYQNLEIIVINDGSKDNSLNKLKEWQKKDKRIKIYDQKNVGIGETRNILISKANGYYFSFLDIDDTLPKKAIELLVTNSLNGHEDIVVGQTKIIYHKKIITIPFIPTSRYVSNMSSGHYIKSNICPPWGCIIKKSYFDSKNIRFIKGRVFEDFGVMTFLYLSTSKFTCINQVVYNYWKNKPANDLLEKNITFFNDLCFKKIDDIYANVKHLFDNLNKNDLFLTKEYKRYINGIMFQIIPSVIFLSSNLTKDKYIRYLLQYNLIYHLYKIKRELKFSKTFWKSITYFYIYARSSSVINNIKKNVFNRQIVYGSYLNDDFNKGEYKYLNFLNQTSIDKKNLVFNIYELKDVDFEKLTFYKKIDGLKLSLNITIKNRSRLKKILLKLQRSNVVPFITVNSKFDLDYIVWLAKHVLGVNIIIDSQEMLSNKEKQIIDRLNDLERKKLIYLTISRNCNLSNVKDKIDGVFIK